MRSPSPLLLVRARPRQAVRSEFERWFRSVHLRDVRRIPGFARVRVARTTRGTLLGLSEFESEESVQQALNSPQAAYARGTWERWIPHLEEFLIELLAPLFSVPLFRSHN